MKRRILLVDDEVAVLLTMKAVLEISGFEVETAASAREGQSRLHTHQYDMVITDMRMESDQAGHEVILAARSAPYHPAVALLTAFPVDEADWQSLGAHQLLLKPMQTRVMLEQIENLFATHEQRLAKLAAPATSAPKTKVSAKKAVKKVAKKIVKPAKKAPAKPAKKAATKTAAAKPAKKASKPTQTLKTTKKLASKPTKKPTSKKAAR